MTCLFFIALIVKSTAWLTANEEGETSIWKASGETAKATPKKVIIKLDANSLFIVNEIFEK